MLKKIKNNFKNRKIARAQKREYIRSLPSHYDNVSISWSAPDKIRYKRGLVWKIIMPALLFSAIIIGVIHNAWTFSLAIAAFVMVYYIINREKPKILEVVLSNIGIKVGDRKYPYTKIKSFWVLYEPPYTKNLYIHVDGDFAVHIPIQLGEQDPAIIREFLLEKIPEKEGMKESFVDMFLKILKI